MILATARPFRQQLMPSGACQQASDRLNLYNPRRRFAPSKSGWAAGDSLNDMYNLLRSAPDGGVLAGYGHPGETEAGDGDAATEGMPGDGEAADSPAADSEDPQDSVLDGAGSGQRRRQTPRRKSAGRGAHAQARMDCGQAWVMHGGLCTGGGDACWPVRWKASWRLPLGYA